MYTRVRTAEAAPKRCGAAIGSWISLSPFFHVCLLHEAHRKSLDSWRLTGPHGARLPQRRRNLRAIHTVDKYRTHTRDGGFLGKPKRGKRGVDFQRQSTVGGFRDWGEMHGRQRHCIGADHLFGTRWAKAWTATLPGQRALRSFSTRRRVAVLTRPVPRLQSPDASAGAL